MKRSIFSVFFFFTMHWVAPFVLTGCAEDVPYNQLDPRYVDPNEEEEIDCDLEEFTVEGCEDEDTIDVIDSEENDS